MLKRELKVLEGFEIPNLSQLLDDSHQLSRRSRFAKGPPAKSIELWSG
jgi:hypothetical protein